MQWLAIAYMTVFFGLVLGTVVYAVIHIVHDDDDAESGS